MVTELIRLKKEIGNRHVCFIGHGESLHELSESIHRFKDLNVCWVSLNQVWMSRNVLSRIGRDLDIILGYAGGYEHAFDNEMCYVHRYSLCRGNSLSEFLFQMNEIGKDVYLFGCDGYSEGRSYYCKLGSKNQNDRHRTDTDELNKNIHKFNNINVINTSESSRYDFPKLSLDEVVDILVDKIVKVPQLIVNKRLV